MSRLKVGVVGVGALGRHHARILSGMEAAELVAVAETNPQQGKAVADSCHCAWVPDYHDLFDRIDAVSIVVPTFAHLAVASEFLKRRIPVLVEKPLAGSVEQAQQLVDLAEEHETLLQVGHVERFNPATQVAWNACSTPRYIKGERLSPYAFRSTDIGVVHDLMIHDIDLVLDLVRAECTSVEAFGVSLLGGHEDCVNARLRFENGCIADLVANRVNTAAKRAMDVWSETGCVRVDFGTREVTTLRPSEALLYGTSPLEKARQPGADIEQLKKDIFGTYIKETKLTVLPQDALTAELAEFVECVQHQRKPSCSGVEGLAAMRVADMVLDSVARHQWEGHAAGAIGAFPFERQERRRKAA